MDRTTTIRASIRDVEMTLIIAICLVILVVFVFLRDFRTMLIPGVAVPVSLIGTFGVMYLLGFSLDNLSLMALTISTGFVVDDAIVVTENITRYLEKGMSPLQAALKGAAEIGFTVMSISLSLVAVFTPILLMAGIVGRLFREFAVTLSVAILVSHGRFAHHDADDVRDAAQAGKSDARPPLSIYWSGCLRGSFGVYEWTLVRVLRLPAITLLVLFATVALNIFLLVVVPKGFFPQQDTGRLHGSIVADQDTSFQAMNQRLQQMIKIVLADKDVATWPASPAAAVA